MGFHPWCFCELLITCYEFYLLQITLLLPVRDIVTKVFKVATGGIFTTKTKSKTAGKGKHGNKTGEKGLGIRTGNTKLTKSRQNGKQPN